MAFWGHWWAPFGGNLILANYDKKFLIVCEGPSDYPVIEGIISHLGNKNGKVFEIEFLQPQVDATTGTYPSFGWTQVKRWCKTYAIKKPSDVSHLPENIRRMVLSKNYETILAFSRADYLIIHMDTDIAEEIDSGFDPAIQTRRELCNNKMNEWLGISVAKANCKYLLPTYAIESWILATYDSSNAPTIFATTPVNYENISDVESKLISIGYASKLKYGVRRLRKDYNRYKNNDKYTPRLLKFLNISKQRCNELEQFTHFIENL